LCGAEALVVALLHTVLRYSLRRHSLFHRTDLLTTRQEFNVSPEARFTGYPAYTTKLKHCAGQPQNDVSVHAWNILTDILRLLTDIHVHVIPEIQSTLLDLLPHLIDHLVDFLVRSTLLPLGMLHPLPKHLQRTSREGPNIFARLHQSVGTRELPDNVCEAHIS
jgi:hypothetical protein